MITKVNGKTAIALVRAKNEAVLPEFIADELLATYKLITTVSDRVAIRQLQGKAQILQDLLDLIEKSPKLAEKMGA